MFTSKNAKKQAEEVSSSSNIIGKGTVITGHVETTSNIRIEGKVVGDIKTKAKVVLGESCQIEGDVIAQNAEIAGTISGIVEVVDLLVLKSSAHVKGDIIAGKLSVEPGAVFNGACKMGIVAKEIVLNGSATNGTTSGKAEKAIL
jgi:cytoskeletal protein CcmA (bactofilin family)